MRDKREKEREGEGETSKCGGMYGSLPRKPYTRPDALINTKELSPELL